MKWYLLGIWLTKCTYGISIVPTNFVEISKVYEFWKRGECASRPPKVSHKMIQILHLEISYNPQPPPKTKKKKGRVKSHICSAMNQYLLSLVSYFNEFVDRTICMSMHTTDA